MAFQLAAIDLDQRRHRPAKIPDIFKPRAHPSRALTWINVGPACVRDSEFMQRSTFMVYVTSGARSDARVRIAGELAARFESKLIGMSVCTYPAKAFATSGPISRDELNYETQKLISDLECRKTNFLQIAGAKNAHNAWRSGANFPTQSVLHELRSADLLIIGKDEAKDKSNQALDPVTVLLRAGRPVLMVPSHVESLRCERIVIAWKDTREARRVVLDALPYLRRANCVIVAAVGEPNQKEAEIKTQLADILDYLAGHGVPAERRVIQNPKQSVGDAIIRLAKEEDADLIVAGAYGHGRIGEWIFGGVTETLVTQSPISCFFSH
jgi:nucleotide-binding universal stress UspA family protein